MSVVDKELIEKYNLEGVRKRFQQISEYTFISKPVLSEDGEEDQQGQQGAPNQQNPQQQPPQGNGGMDMQQPPQDANGMGGQQPPQYANGMSMPQQPQDAGMPDGNMPPSPDGNMGDMPPEGMDMNGGADMPQDAGMEPPVDTMQDGDEVIDVDELTNAQETAEVKIDGVNDKLQDLLAVTTKFIAAVDQNNKKIDDLRAEFERRNPSDEERINIRSQASAPYSETPKSYWNNKIGNSNYNVIYNNDVDPDKEDEEYLIKKGDINANDERSLAKSLDYPSELKDFLSF